MKEQFTFPRLFLSLFLIIVGLIFAYLFFTGLFTFVELGSFIGLLFYIPTILLVVVLPIYAGVGLIIAMLKRKGDS